VVVVVLDEFVVVVEADEAVSPGLAASVDGAGAGAGAGAAAGAGAGAGAGSSLLQAASAKAAIAATISVRFILYP